MYQPMTNDCCARHRRRKCRFSNPTCMRRLVFLQAAVIVWGCASPSSTLTLPPFQRGENIRGPSIAPTEGKFVGCTAAKMGGKTTTAQRGQVTRMLFGGGSGAGDQDRSGGRRRAEGGEKAGRQILQRRPKKDPDGRSPITLRLSNDRNYDRAEERTTTRAALSFGPLNFRGRVDDSVSQILCSSGHASATSTVAATMQPLVSTWSSVRGRARLVRRRFINLAVGGSVKLPSFRPARFQSGGGSHALLNNFRGGAVKTEPRNSLPSSTAAAAVTTLTASRPKSRSGSVGALPWRRRNATKIRLSSSPSSLSPPPEVFGLLGGGPGNPAPPGNVGLSSRAPTRQHDATVELWKSLSSRFTGSLASGSVTVASPSSSSVADTDSDSDSWVVIRTPLFPVILPKEWEPSRTAVEISVASPSAAIATRVSGVALPGSSSPELLRAASQPLIPTDLWNRFTGTEFQDVSVLAALAQTGLRLADPQTTDGCGIQWSTDGRKTSKFVDDRTYGSTAWYDDLDASQEVLVWTGMFDGGSTNGSPGRGAHLPVIKTTSIVRQSPEFIANLLMDSSKVKAYNKLSVGRTDEVIFQRGIDTVGGEFGDGESKVVRNLTKPPVVNSIIELVTCMHARKLRNDDDLSMVSPGENVEGYIVVSRAVTGGKWSDGDEGSGSGDKRVRSEILLGVNVLRAVPGQPDKTELTAVTHVYSPLVPKMLAKSAGVKGAVDFVRDIRALPQGNAKTFE